LKKWLSPVECAKHIGVSIHTLYQWVAKRTIPYTKVPKSNLIRFDSEKVDKWLDSGAKETMEESI
jgi:excisionase family DNA binding protein